MHYVNCGAFGSDGKRIKTKKQLREELAVSPGEVFFDETSAFATSSGYAGDNIPEGIVLSVVMPDPYRDRRVYATCRLVGGILRVS